MEDNITKKDICLIYNYAQHYRLGIFKLLNNEMSVHFYFGNKMSDVKKLDYTELSNFEKEINNIRLLGPLYWQKGALSVLFKPYKHYIILGEYFCLSTWLIAVLAPFFRKKIYFWSHGWYGKESGFMKLFKKAFFKLADHIFLYGDRAKNLLIKQGFDKNRLHVIYNSLNYEEQITIRKKLLSSDLYHDIFNNNFPTIIFIGRLTKVKKLSWIVEALHVLKKKNINVNLCLIGSGEEKSTLLDIVTKYDLNAQVSFQGAIYDESIIAQYIYDAAICISPGNVGLTAMHSMVFGTPVITNDDFNTQMPEYEAIVKNVTGDFFVNNDIMDLALKIETWIGGTYDRETVRLNCFKQIDHYFNPNYQLKIFKNVITTDD